MSDTNSIPSQQILRGVPVSSGIAIDSAYVINDSDLIISKELIAEENVAQEIKRFHEAIALSIEQLDQIQKRIDPKKESLLDNIIASHQSMIQDVQLLEKTKQFIQEHNMNVEWACQCAIEDIKQDFESLESIYFQERMSDVEAVGKRIINNIVGTQLVLDPLPTGSILVGKDVSAIELIQFFHMGIKAILLEEGGATSHCAIVARKYKIPAIMGVQDLCQTIKMSDPIALDGTTGEIIIHPTDALCHSLLKKKEKQQIAFDRLCSSERGLLAKTQDDVLIRLMANVGLPNEIPLALQYGATGVGLFRTEFIYLVNRSTLSESNHVEYVKKTFDLLKGAPVIFRTFDFAADKNFVSISSLKNQKNPALGLRSIRFSLDDTGRDLFVTQLRGFLKASIYGKLRIMFPMISQVEELLEVKNVVNQVKQDLINEGVSIAENVEIGIVLETPSAALIIEDMLDHLDFISLGTNDLIQYTLAVDRGNHSVLPLYDGAHPAVLRLIQHVVTSAASKKIPVSVCGEMAGDPDLALLLIGLGVLELSMDPYRIPEIKHRIRSIDFKELNKESERLIKLATATEIRQGIKTYIHEAMTDV